MATLPQRRYPFGQGRGFATDREAVDAARDLDWTVTFKSHEPVTAEDGKWFLCEVDGRWYWELTWDPLGVP